jgi:hypothetical protein
LIGIDFSIFARLRASSRAALRISSVIVPSKL